MTFPFSLRTKLLGTSSLAAGAFMFGAGILAASPAYAACSGTPVADNAVITCSGLGNTSITGTADDASVTMSGGSISGTGAPAIQLIGDRNTVTLNSGALATSTGSDYYGTIDMYGDDATLIIDDANIVTRSAGESTPGIILDGDNVTFTFSAGVGGSAVYLDTVGTDAESYAAAVVRSRNLTVTLNADTLLKVRGYGGVGKEYLGLDVVNYATDTSERGMIMLGENASTSVYLNGATTGAKIYGIREVGNGPGSLAYASDIVLNDGSTVVTANGAVNGRLVGSMQIGDYGTITLNGNASARVYSYGGSNSDLAGIGQYGDHTDVTLNDTSWVSVGGNGGAASYFTGIGVGGEETTITLNGTASVYVNFTEAISALGVVTNSDYGSLTLNDYAYVRMSGHSNAGGAGVAIYGYANTVTLNDDALINTLNATTDTRGMVGLLVGGNLYTTVTLNDRASILAADAPAIVMSGGLYNSLTIGKDASVSGVYGIYVDDSFDTLTINGTVTGTGGTAISVYYGSDSTIILNAATINGSIEGGGSGNGDRLFLEGSGALTSNVLGFDELTVDATGTWTLGALTSTFADTVTINSGKLVALGNIYAASGLTIEAGATLGGTGTIFADITNNGTLSPGQSPGTLNVVGSATMAAGSVFEVEVEGLASDQLNVSGAPGTVTIAPGAILQTTFSGATDGFAGDIITATGGITGTFTISGSGALDYSNPNVLTLMSTSSSSFNGALSAGASQGFLFLDTVLGQAGRNAAQGKTLWASGLTDRSDRAGDGTSRGFETRNAGGAFGGEVWRSGGMKLGLAAGYLDGKATTTGGGSRSTIDGYHAAAYGSVRSGSTWAGGAVTAAYQDQSVSRNVLAGGVLSTARAAPEAWSGGAGFVVGHDLALNGAFTLTPQAGVTYQHLERDGFSETGGGAAAIALDSISTDTVRAQAGAELSLNIADPNATWKVRPAIRAGLVREWRGGDGSAGGFFLASGSAFTAKLDQRDQSYLALGAGLDVGIGHGVTAFITYDGSVGGDVETSDGVRGGLRIEW